MIVSYCRQSLNLGDKESSVVWQYQKILKHAHAQGLAIQRNFEDIKSGKNINRPGFQDLINLIESKQVLHIIVYKFDRIARSTKDFLTFLELCVEFNVILESVAEGKYDPNSHIDRLKIKALATIAELHIESHRENLQLVNKKKVSEGRLANRRAPFGYRYTDGKFVVNPDEAPTVRFVFDEYNRGNGYKKISLMTKADENLQERTPAQVRYILLNEKYTGVYVSKYGRVEGLIPSIITRDTFEIAQTQRNDRSESLASDYIVDAKLRKKIICPHCGKKMTTYYYRKQTNSLPKYVCQKKITGHYSDCKMVAIPMRKLENEVIQLVLRYLTSQPMIDHLRKQTESIVLTRRKERMDKLRNLNASKNHLIDDLSQQNITLSHFKVSLDLIQQQIDDIENEPMVSDVITDTRLLDILKNHQDISDELLNLIESVRVTDDGQVLDIKIHGKDTAIDTVTTDKNNTKEKTI